ncbi:SRPBCC family protein [Kitasatospora sp. NPDC088783]|uniref:SRPBCC family protein n=1 Tax=Kitasatospora sp. NPDC088783 TaxID=3364077 RepID=UPI00381455E4
MATIHFTERTLATPEQFVACLTDFTPGRRELFPNSADEFLRVHTEGPDHAEVTEGSGGVWERLRYDWSDPHRVVMTTVDSNLWGGASGHTYTLTPLPDGTTRLDAVVVREGKNLKGRITGLLLGSVGRGVLGSALKKTVAAVESRHRLTRP